MNPQMTEINIIKVVKKGINYQVIYKAQDGEELEQMFNEEQILIYRIIVGKSYTIDDWNLILKDGANYQVFNKVLHFISYMPRTINETRQYLNKFQLDDNEKDKLIDRFITLRYLDDELYVKAYVNDAILAHKGPRLIRNNLEQKMIDSKLITESLAFYTNTIEQENIKELINKEIVRNTDLPILKQKEKLSQKLIRLGFSTYLINREIQQTNFQSNNECFERDFIKLIEKDIDKNKIITILLRKGYPYQVIKEALNKHNIK